MSTNVSGPSATNAAMTANAAIQQNQGAWNDQRVEANAKENLDLIVNATVRQGDFNRLAVILRGWAGLSRTPQ
jgi:hypothetical protein